MSASAGGRSELQEVCVKTGYRNHARADAGPQLAFGMSPSTPIPPGRSPRALQAGVRSIEHGNLLDDESVRLLRTCDAYLVSTLVRDGRSNTSMRHGDVLSTNSEAAEQLS